MKILGKRYPKTPVPLDHKDNFTLLVAVLLSAQCTDERVNKVTPKLFQLANNAKNMRKQSPDKIYEIINGRLYTDRIHDTAVISDNKIIEGPSFQLRYKDSFIYNSKAEDNIIFQKGFG